MTETAVSENAVYRARPTIRIDGQEFARAQDLLIAMEMAEQEGGLSAMELRFSNIASDQEGGAGYAFEDEQELQLGSVLNVYAGDETAPREIFRGMITGLEAEYPESGPPELVVLAEDALQLARMTRRTRVFEEMSIRDLAANVAENLSLSPVIDGFTDVTGLWVQLNESDLAFLRRLLRRYDADLQVVGDELHIAPRSEVRRGNLELELFAQLRSVKFIADLTDQVSEVTVTGWDALSGQRISASSSGQNPGPGMGRRSADILQRVAGERHEHIGHIAVTTDEEARILAHTVFDQRARRFVCAHGVAEGNPALRVGTHITLSGVSRRFQNSYYVVAVQHRFDVNKGYQTHFKAECHALGDAS